MEEAASPASFRYLQDYVRQKSVFSPAFWHSKAIGEGVHMHMQVCVSKRGSSGLLMWCEGSWACAGGR